MNWPKQDMSHLKMPVGFENVPPYICVEFMLDFPDYNKVARQKLFLSPVDGDYASLKEGDIVEYDTGNDLYGRLDRDKENKKISGTAKVISVDKVEKDDGLDKLIIRLESIT